MDANGRELSTKQSKAIAALLSERSIDAAAKAAGIGQTTMHRWLNDDLFVAALRQAEAGLLDAATRRLLALQGDAIDALQNVLQDGDTPPGTRVQAARVVLEAMLKLRDSWQVEQRLTMLEGMIGNG